MQISSNSVANVLFWIGTVGSSFFFARNWLAGARFGWEESQILSQRDSLVSPGFNNPAGQTLRAEEKMCDFHQFQTDESQRKWIALFDRNLHRITNRKQMDSFSLLRHRFTGWVLSITFIGIKVSKLYNTWPEVSMAHCQIWLDFRHKKNTWLLDVLKSRSKCLWCQFLSLMFFSKPKHWVFWMKMFHCKHASWLQCFFTPEKTHNMEPNNCWNL